MIIYPKPEKNLMVMNTSLVMDKQDSMPKRAFTVIENIKMDRRPKESPKAPHINPPISIPIQKKRFINIYKS